MVREKDVLPITGESVLTKKQKKTFGPRRIEGYVTEASIIAEVRFDDECGNGHNTFAITGTVRTKDRRSPDKGYLAGGCLHEDIAKIFPELAPFIKWHLCSTDGPMHYPANALYHAGDKDCWGRRSGEPSAFSYGVRFNGVPLTHRIPSRFWSFLRDRQGTGEFRVFSIAHPPSTGYQYSPHYSLVGFADKWHEAPFSDKTAAEEFCKAMNTCQVEFVQVPTDWSEGKPRELDAARNAAVWPDATDEELTAPDLRERLIARLPALLAEFRKDVESLGFTW